MINWIYIYMIVYNMILINLINVYYYIHYNDSLYSSDI